MKNMDDNMKVFVRVRPFNQKQSNTQTLISSLSEKAIKIKDKQSQQDFSFDHIFNQNSIQSQVYQKVGKQIVQSAFQGINGTIFAYGQTSSGKTHTCIGPDYEDQIKKGILPRLISHLFQKINDSVPYIEYRIKISMVEIYMQKIKDLFQISKNDLKIRQNKTKGIYLQDVTQQYVASTTQAINLFKKGIANRTVGQTNMNDVSSRSHMAFVITLHQNNLKDASAKSGKIILVDLAGSQKVSKTLAQGKVLDQAKQINKSLSSLGNVITALTDPKISHIPYRDSKLTRLLQQSLGGNSKTNLIINISPSSYNFSQSLSSLRFGFRAKQIKNKPKVNRQYTVAQLLILLQKAEKKNQQLQQMIKELTMSKRKTIRKQGPTFIQNLLDSDNPMLSGLSQNEGDGQQTFKKQLSGIKQVKFQSQCQEEEKRSKVTAFDQQKQQLIQMVQQLTFQKNQITRQAQLMEEKYQQAAKQARLLTNKMNSHQKQNQKILQRLISSKLQIQQKQKAIKEIQKKLESYQESINELISLRQSKSSKIFGNNSGMLSGAQKIIKKYEQFHHYNHNQPSQINQIQQSKSAVQRMEQKDKKIQQLSHQIQTIRQDLILFKTLDQSKEQFIKQKMKFIQEKQRVYSDLQNRVQKVLELQQKLDEEKQKNKFYAQIVDSSQSEKGRKILSMQKHLQEISENYYVLKGQQSSWLNNNKRYEKKIQKKDNKIAKLQQQIIQLRQQVQNLRLNSQDLQDLNHDLDLDFSVIDQESQHQQGKIVKVLKSNIFY